jgi:adenine-specific DNA-methyltransferase
MSYERLRPTFTFDAERIEQLKAIVPEAFADGAINWEALRAALGDYLEEEGADAEHFGLFWPGKRAARRRASEPSRGTLIPVPGEGVNEDTTRNVFIEADNLDALKLIQKAYVGTVKMIYIDPPYNTGKDFVYNDDFRETKEEHLRRTFQVNELGQFLTTNPKASGRFHSNWLNMMYPRLQVARSLLTEDGVIFVSIDDNELHNLLQVMNEVFGDENAIGIITVQLNPRGRHLDSFLVPRHSGN